MKKILVVAVLIALPLMAWSASTSPVAGSYKGSLTYVANAAIQIPNPSATVKTNEIEFKYDGGLEKWTLSGDKLIQVELDPKTMKEIAKYTATFKDGRYWLDCPGGTCPANGDARSNWEIVTTGNTFKYIVNSVPKTDRANASATPIKQIELTFTKAN